MKKLYPKLFLLITFLCVAGFVVGCGGEDNTYQKALDKIEAGQLKEALSLLETVTDNRPDFAEARNNMGSIYLMRKDLDKARGCFRKALDLEPEYAKARANLGNVYMARGSEDKAFEEYRKALEINPASEEANYNLGSIYFRRGRMEEA